MISKQDRVRARTVEDLERKYDFDRKFQQMKSQQQAKGQDGLTPFIGENGNWWIGTSDTGVYANGTKVSFVPASTNGIKIGTITIDGVPMVMYVDASNYVTKEAYTKLENTIDALEQRLSSLESAADGFANPTYGWGLGNGFDNLSVTDITGGYRIRVVQGVSPASASNIDMYCYGTPNKNAKIKVRVLVEGDNPNLPIDYSITDSACGIALQNSYGGNTEQEFIVYWDDSNPNINLLFSYDIGFTGSGQSVVFDITVFEEN